ncbi:MAG: DUF262 domain-containing protein [Bacteroidales bacterium]|nr:DUF262 domain-containing protein [Bacteroidales bacterium]
MASVESNDRKLNELLAEVANGKTQLPDFQRSWVWDNTQICKLIESITSGYPMGAVMYLMTGGDVHFKYRLFTGVDKNAATANPEYLVLDGQQRLTTLFQVLASKKPVETCLETKRNKKILRYYYLDIKGCLDSNTDRLDAIISVSENKTLTEDIGRNIKLDLSSPKKEYENLKFPLNILFSPTETMHWMLGLLAFYHNDPDILSLYTQFNEKVVQRILDYQLPVIKLSKDLPKEAVCQIFENVNTGGVPLTVFELVTATFAADNYNLREDWEKIKASFASKKNGEILSEIYGANFLQSMTLLVSYKKSLKGLGAVTCKKKDVLALDLKDYLANHDLLVQGFCDAADFLVHQGFYRSKDLPYSSQIVPLAAIFAYNKESNGTLHLAHHHELLCRWYWCGVFGELYGSANEARYALDIANIFEWIKGGNQPDTVVRASFQPTRLLSMRTRNSAAYKGVMALIMQDSPNDFMTGNKMDVASYIDESTDIHHIFPQAYCISQKYPSNKWDSVVNKTPIYASTNRSIGGRAPSEYVKTMRTTKGLSEDVVRNAIESHKINADYLFADDFDNYFVDRAIRLLNRIESAMGKVISGRDSDETIKEFGRPLLSL